MATTYSTKFDKGRVVKSSDGLTNVLVNVWYTIVATSDDGYVKILKKSIDLPAPTPSQFIDINQVTENDIISWIEAQPTYLTDDEKKSLESRIDYERKKPEYDDYMFSFFPYNELRFNLVN